MTTYKEIKGQLIRSVSSDPTNPQEGQIWYNNTIGVLKGYQTVAAAWSSGGTLNTGRGALGASGTLTAGLVFGGYATTVGGNTNTSEEYDGSSWTPTGNLNTAMRAMAGFGTQTASVSGGGYNESPAGASTITQLYDGSSWTTNPTGL